MWLVLICILYTETLIVSITLPESASHYSKLSNWMEVVGAPRLQPIGQMQWPGEYLNLQLASEERVAFFFLFPSSSSLFLIPEVFIGLLPPKGYLTFAA